MARRFTLERLWNDDNFVIEKGVIEPKATLSGSDLGEGIIYCPAGASLKHRLPGIGEDIATIPAGDVRAFSQ